jgi:hypothetical protein
MGSSSIRFLGLVAKAAPVINFSFVAVKSGDQVVYGGFTGSVGSGDTEYMTFFLPRSSDYPPLLARRTAS